MTEMRITIIITKEMVSAVPELTVSRRGSRLLEGEASRDLGELRALRGDHAGALKKLRAALATFTDLGARRDIAGVRALIEQVAAQRNGPG